MPLLSLRRTLRHGVRAPLTHPIFVGYELPGLVKAPSQMPSKVRWIVGFQRLQLQTISTLQRHRYQPSDWVALAIRLHKTAPVHRAYSGPLLSARLTHRLDDRDVVPTMRAAAGFELDAWQ